MYWLRLETCIIVIFRYIIRVYWLRLETCRIVIFRYIIRVYWLRLETCRIVIFRYIIRVYLLRFETCRIVIFNSAVCLPCRLDATAKSAPKLHRSFSSSNIYIVYLSKLRWFIHFSSPRCCTSLSIASNIIYIDYTKCISLWSWPLHDTRCLDLV